MKIRVVFMVKSLTQKLFVSVRRFPVSLLLTTVTAVIFIYLQHMRAELTKETIDLIVRVAKVCALGIPLSLCLKVTFERKPTLKKLWKIVLCACTLAILLYFLFLLEKQNMNTTMRYIGFTLAFYITFTFIPYFYKKDNYEIYVVKLITSLFVTYLYSMILYGGLSAILFTIDKLFNAHINSNLYIDMLLIVSGIFAPAFFFSEIPEQGKELHIQSYPKVLSILLIYIVMPIIAAYSLILYAYFAKIIIQRQWPNGLVSNLVLWYSLISTLTIFLVYPLRSGTKWTKYFINLFPKLVLPLILMMFISMGIRVRAYGITEARYFVLLAGIWVSGVMLYLGFSKRVRTIILTLSLALLCIISTAGPLSSNSISMFSQNKRFENILQKNYMLKDNIIAKAPDSISNDDKKDLVSIISYFNSIHSLENLKHMPKNFNMNDFQNVLGFDPAQFISPEYNKEDYFNYMLDQNDKLIEIKDYSYFFYFSEVYVKIPPISGKDIDITYSQDSNELKILQKNKTVYQVSILDIASKIYRDNKGRDTLSREQLSFTDENENVKVLLIFNQIGGREDALNKITLNPPEFYLFIKFKNQ